MSDDIRNDLVKRYLRTCWILKIRLMSSRRQLWSDTVSLIHLENACLQIRKICEGTMHLAVVAGEIEFERLPKKIRRKYKVGEVLKHLDRSGQLRFPKRTKVELKEEAEGQVTWDISVHADHSRDDWVRVAAIWNEVGKFMHEPSVFNDWPAEADEATGILLQCRNSMRGDHQFLWNLLWHHSIDLLDSSVFVVRMMDAEKPTCPSLVISDGIASGDLTLDFDADFVSDFSGDIDWSDFDTNE